MPEDAEKENLRRQLGEARAALDRSYKQFRGAAYAHALLLEEVYELIRIIGGNPLQQTPKEMRVMAVAMREVCDAAKGLVFSESKAEKGLLLVQAVRDLKKLEEKAPE